MSRPRRIPGLPSCPECNATVEELVHIAPGIASAKPCGCVFAPGEFFPEELLEAEHDRELVADGGQCAAGTEHREHYLFISRRWGRKAEENVEEWGLQGPALILLAMMEEMGEIAEELRAEIPGPSVDNPDDVPHEAARLLYEIAELGLETQEFLESNFEQPAGEKAPDEDRPVDRCGVGPVHDPEAVSEELTDLAPLCFQLTWALNNCNVGTETDRSGGDGR